MRELPACPYRFGGRCVVSVILALAFLAQSVSAMTPEDCSRLRATIAKTFPPVEALRLSPSVTADKWCRVIDGPLGGGLEWRVTGERSSFLLEVRQDPLEVEGLGPFSMAGRVQALDGGEVEVGPFRFETRAGDRASVGAMFVRVDGQAATEALGLSRAALTVAGDRALIDEVLAWAFRLDLKAARSSLIEARNQRDDMLSWLDEVALHVVDDESARDFMRLVEAYPWSRGVAQITTREDRPVQIGPLISAVLFGSAFSEREASELVADAGLRFTWQPD